MICELRLRLRLWRLCTRSLRSLPEFKVQSLNSSVLKSRISYRIPNTEHLVPNTMNQMPSTEHRVPNITYPHCCQFISFFLSPRLLVFSSRPHPPFLDCIRASSWFFLFFLLPLFFFFVKIYISISIYLCVYLFLFLFLLRITSFLPRFPPSLLVYLSFYTLCTPTPRPRFLRGKRTGTGRRKFKSRGDKSKEEERLGETGWDEVG